MLCYTGEKELKHNHEICTLCYPGEKESKRNEQITPKREDQLAHLNMEMAPPSPSPGPSATSVGVDSSTMSITRENSSACIAHLPPDTQKFLKFAGKLPVCCLSHVDTQLGVCVWVLCSGCGCVCVKCD